MKVGWDDPALLLTPFMAGYSTERSEAATEGMDMLYFKGFLHSLHSQMVGATDSLQERIKVLTFRTTELEGVQLS